MLAPLLYRLSPEHAHELARFSGHTAAAVPGVGALLQSLFAFRSERIAMRAFGLDFPAPIGMAAGFDKQGDLYPFLARMGFGFIESGTFSAKAQPGNPRPRLFRYPDQDVLINRMGFNNPGADRAARRIAAQGRIASSPHGINIGKSKVTPLEEAVEDYLYSVERLLPYADYIAVNVSSPNTPELRKLQEKDRLFALLSEIQKNMQFEGRRVPLLVKLAPDLTDAELEEVLEVSQSVGLDGIILTNTTLDHSSIPAGRDEAGGLSGPPVASRSTAMIARTYRRTEGKLPIIGVGGIASAADALDKIRAGASLVQVYTGYIFQGPGLPGAICRGLHEHCERENVKLAELVGSGEV